VTTTIIGREYDHNDQCIACGAHCADPCGPDCAFETGTMTPAVVLRAATRRLRDFKAFRGADIAAAITHAAASLSCTPRQDGHRSPRNAVEDLVTDARAALGAYFDLLTRPDSALPNVAMIDPYGVLVPRSQITATLYTAAALEEGREFEAQDDEFSSFDD
jgi:hypothetical protein